MDTPDSIRVIGGGTVVSLGAPTVPLIGSNVMKTAWLCPKETNLL